jgi:hypothetical protein
MTDSGATREKTAAIRARAEVATAGPWFREYNSAVLAGPDEDSSSAEWDAAQIAHCGKPRDKRDLQRINDADFIAHAREDIPYLLGLLAALAPEPAETVAPENSTILDGATSPGNLYAYPATPEEFAARWNSWSKPERSEWLKVRIERDQSAHDLIVGNIVNDEAATLFDIARQADEYFGMLAEPARWLRLKAEAFRDLAVEPVPADASESRSPDTYISSEQLKAVPADGLSGERELSVTGNDKPWIPVPGEHAVRSAQGGTLWNAPDEPKALDLDPEPWLDSNGNRWHTQMWGDWTFTPRPGYEQSESKYPGGQR